MSDQPKMTPEQAKLFWNSLDPTQRFQFNELMERMFKGELMLKDVNVDDNEQIQNIVLEPKDKTSAPMRPFLDHFGKEIKDA